MSMDLHGHDQVGETSKSVDEKRRLFRSFTLKKPKNLPETEMKTTSHNFSKSSKDHEPKKLLKSLSISSFISSKEKDGHPVSYHSKRSSVSRQSHTSIEANRNALQGSSVIGDSSKLSVNRRKMSSKFTASPTPPSSPAEKDIYHPLSINDMPILKDLDRNSSYVSLRRGSIGMNSMKIYPKAASMLRDRLIRSISYRNSQQVRIYFDSYFSIN